MAVQVLIQWILIGFEAIQENYYFQNPDPHRFDKLRKMDKNSGLSDLSYLILNIYKNSCYTHIIVDIG